MNTLAFHGGPGPWILLFPLFWGAAVFGVITLLRRAGRPGGRGGRGGRGGGFRGPWQAPGPAHDDQSPIAMLGRRFAAGEIDEDEYWRRLSVLDEQFGRVGKAGPA
ncbi:MULTISPECIES: SHOCT domain-containing protein [unclassified Streptomyces]|uniref:SHOCT domain-containing protein n=1 Tax=unclassified Streptomyces TaxID=2593676 RepID=UPI002E2E17FF|nr:SHOCT domain-containing protein [Streptomyces sp. NBC_01429]